MTEVVQIGSKIIVKITITLQITWSPTYINSKKAREAYLLMSLPVDIGLYLFSSHCTLSEILLLENDPNPRKHLETHQDQGFHKFDTEEAPHLSQIDLQDTIYCINNYINMYITKESVHVKSLMPNHNLN